MKLLSLTAAALVGVAFAGVAPDRAAAPGVAYAAPAPPRMAGGCFRSHDIRNHTFGDKNTMYLDVSGKGVYRVTTKGSCLSGAVSSDPLVMESPPGQAYICRPIDLDVSVARGGSFPVKCFVDTITPMSKEEVAALPKKLQP